MALALTGSAGTARAFVEVRLRECRVMSRRPLFPAALGVRRPDGCGIHPNYETVWAAIGVVTVKLGVGSSRRSASRSVRPMRQTR